MEEVERNEPAWLIEGLCRVNAGAPVDEERNDPSQSIHVRVGELPGHRRSIIARACALARCSQHIRDRRALRLFFEARRLGCPCDQPGTVQLVDQEDRRAIGGLSLKVRSNDLEICLVAETDKCVGRPKVGMAPALLRRHVEQIFDRGYADSKIRNGVHQVVDSIERADACVSHEMTIPRSERRS